MDQQDEVQVKPLQLYRKSISIMVDLDSSPEISPKSPKRLQKLENYEIKENVNEKDTSPTNQLDTETVSLKDLGIIENEIAPIPKVKVEPVQEVQQKKTGFPSSFKRATYLVKTLLIPKKKGGIGTISKALRFQGSINAFENSQKNSIVEAIKNPSKSFEEMTLLRKHMRNCSFFINFAIPMGEDVFDSCLKRLKIIPCEINVPLISKGQDVKLLYIILDGSLFKSKSSLITKNNNENEESNNYQTESQEQLQSSLIINKQLPSSPLPKKQEYLQSPMLKNREYLQSPLLKNREQQSPLPSKNMISALDDPLSLNSSQKFISNKVEPSLENPSKNNSSLIQNQQNEEQFLILPISSFLESQFMQCSQSPFFYIPQEGTIVASLTTKDFEDAVACSKNREFVMGISSIRVSRFFSEWPIVKIKHIVYNSSILNYRLHQYVYSQQEDATEWYIVLEGEFQYTMETTVSCEISEVETALLGERHHEFMRQKKKSEEKQKEQIKVSILQKGEIFGLEDVLPEQKKRQYNVKCISSEGQVRKVGEGYLAKILQKYRDDYKILCDLAKQKREYLNNSAKQKIPLAQQIHNALEKSKRAVQLKQLQAKNKNRKDHFSMDFIFEVKSDDLKELKKQQKRDNHFLNLQSQFFTQKTEITYQDTNDNKDPPLLIPKQDIPTIINNDTLLNTCEETQMITDGFSPNNKKLSQISGQSSTPMNKMQLTPISKKEELQLNDSNQEIITNAKQKQISLYENKNTLSIANLDNPFKRKLKDSKSYGLLSNNSPISLKLMNLSKKEKPFPQHGSFHIGKDMIFDQRTSKDVNKSGFAFDSRSEKEKKQQSNEQKEIVNQNFKKAGEWQLGMVLGVEDNEKEKRQQRQKELEKEILQMKQAKEQLLQSYRVTIREFVNEYNQKLYYKIEKNNNLVTTSPQPTPTAEKLNSRKESVETRFSNQKIKNSLNCSIDNEAQINAQKDLQNDNKMNNTSQSFIQKQNSSNYKFNNNLITKFEDNKSGGSFQQAQQSKFAQFLQKLENNNHPNINNNDYLNYKKNKIRNSSIQEYQKNSFSQMNMANSSNYFNKSIKWINDSQIGNSNNMNQGYQSALYLQNNQINNPEKNSLLSIFDKIDPQLSIPNKLKKVLLNHSQKSTSQHFVEPIKIPPNTQSNQRLEQIIQNKMGIQLSGSFPLFSEAKESPLKKQKNKNNNSSFKIQNDTKTKIDENSQASQLKSLKETLKQEVTNSILQQDKQQVLEKKQIIQQNLQNQLSQLREISPLTNKDRLPSNQVRDSMKKITSQSFENL